MQLPVRRGLIPYHPQPLRFPLVSILLTKRQHTAPCLPNRYSVGPLVDTVELIRTILNLERALIEYVQRYGVTDAARDAFRHPVFDPPPLDPDLSHGIGGSAFLQEGLTKGKAPANSPEPPQLSESGDE